MKIRPETPSLIPHLRHSPFSRKVKADDGSEIRNPKSEIRNPSTDGGGHTSSVRGEIRSEGLRVRDMAGTVRPLADLLSVEEQDMLSRLFPSSTLAQGVRAYETKHKEGTTGPRLGGHIDVRT